MGSPGKQRKAQPHLPKVQGNAGRLWGDEPVPWSMGENFLRTVGRVGPSAQAAYFKRHPNAARVVTVVAGAVVAATVLAATLMIVR